MSHARPRTGERVSALDAMDLLYLVLGLAACIVLAFEAEDGAAAGLATLLAVLAYRLRARALPDAGQ